MTEKEELEKISVRLPVSCIDKIDLQVGIETRKRKTKEEKKHVTRSCIIKRALKIGLDEMSRMNAEAIAA